MNQHHNASDDIPTSAFEHTLESDLPDTTLHQEETDAGSASPLDFEPTLESDLPDTTLHHEEADAGSDSPLDFEPTLESDLPDTPLHHEETDAGSASPSASYSDFKRKFSEQENPEQRLSLALDFMERSLTQQGMPHFKEFWEVRRECLSLFKENINPSSRTHLWSRYCELSREARRLKEILDEQTAFAMEQIEIAIKALEEELATADIALKKTPEIILNGTPTSLSSDKLDLYNQLQRRLSLLNAQAARIDVLREELIKTEMRVRHKNKFFERLSSAGDQVFPSRKELIKQNSTQFINDVDHFVSLYFPEQEPQGDIFALREEIKAWQFFAKQLTLNSHAFTHSRRALSECWDTLKQADKERKKSRSLQRSKHKQNAELIAADLLSLQGAIEREELPLEEMQHRLSHFNDTIRRTDLEREDVRALRTSLDEIHRDVEAKEKIRQSARDNEDRQRLQARLQKVSQFKERAVALTTKMADAEMEEVMADYQQLIQDYDAAGLSKQEKQQLERPFKALRNNIALMKDRQMFALASNDEGGENVDKKVLITDLEKLQAHRQQIKLQLEALKKQAGSSGLDFSRAIELTEQIQIEKERLDKTDKALRELNSKLRRSG